MIEVVIVWILQALPRTEHTTLSEFFFIASEAAFALFDDETLQGLRPEDVHDWIYPDEVLYSPRKTPNEYTRYHNIRRVLAAGLGEEHGYSVDEAVKLYACKDRNDHL